MKKTLIITCLSIAAIALGQVEKNEIIKTVSYLKNYSGNTNISKKNLLELDTLKVISKPTDATSSILFVTSFDLTVVIPGKPEKRTLNYMQKGSVLTKDAKTILIQTTKGSKVFIDNIKASNKNKQIVKNIPGITLNVNE